MNYLKNIISILAFCVIYFNSMQILARNVFHIKKDSPWYIDQSFFSILQPKGGDTIFIMSDRTKGIRFSRLIGDENQPIVIINKGGQVDIQDEGAWGALTFENCNHIKVTGTGSVGHKNGFKLSAQTCGLAFTEYSSDCEAEFIEIDHDGFFGVYAKKDFSGNPPFPYPEFEKLTIHDLSIRNVSVGMYLGETKSPGMVFKHVRVYNNLVVNTGREGIQVANMIEDVEVFNNTIVGSGTDNETFQGNNFQIGDNCVGKYYNNVFIDAPANGMIIMGAGNIEVFNNYFENNMGIFVDNRQFTTPLAPIIIRDNYFTRINNAQIVKNMNEINPMEVTNNHYDGTAPFMLANDLKAVNLKASGNQLTTIQLVDFQDTLLYEILPASLYFKVANGACSAFNSWPVIEPIAETYVFVGDTLIIPLRASVSDRDLLDFKTDSLPAFITFTDSVNGWAKLVVKPLSIDTGTHELIITVSDRSHQASDRIKLRFIVALRTNQAPAIQTIENKEIICLAETIVPVVFTDTDHDQIIPRLINAPAFVQIESTGNQTFQLRIKPKFLDNGIFNFQVAYTDSHSPEIMYPVQINVGLAALIPNMPVYRLNCGGPELNAINLNWESVWLSNSGKRYVATHSYETGSHKYKDINATSAPSDLFGPYSYDYPGGTELEWKFLVPNGKYKVNLFFREKQSDIDYDGMKSMFDVLIEGIPVLSRFVMFDECAGNPLQKTFEVLVHDQILNIDFRQIAGKPRVSGIEIIFLEAGNMPPAIGSVADQTVLENDTLILPLNLTDELEALSPGIVFSLRNAPACVSLQSNLATHLKELHIQPDYHSEGIYNNVVVLASDGEFTDSISFRLTVVDQVQANYPKFQVQKSLTMKEGERVDLANIVFDPENDPLIVTCSRADYVTAEFVNGQWNLVVAPDYYSSGSYTLLLSATDDKGYTSLDSLKISVTNYSPQIVLNSTMITDEVKNGSVDSPNYLVDEQYLTPENKGKPASKSWKPAYNANNAPYNITINLGGIYDLTSIAVHDMNNVGPLVISVGSPGNWTELYTETTNSYISWKVKPVQVATQYLRITLNAGSAAYINELVLKGTLQLNLIEKSASIDGENNNTSANRANSELITDPIPINNPMNQQRLSNESGISELTTGIEVKANLGRSHLPVVYPTRFSECIYLLVFDKVDAECQISLYNLKGQEVLSDRVVISTNSPVRYQENLASLACGIYVLKLTDCLDGETNSFKLIKSN